MNKTCLNCSSAFEVTDDDLKFYDKVSPVFGGKKYLIPPPTFCPDCRQQRRISFRNERMLYKRKCDSSGKQIISIYSPDSPFAVYDRDEWWSDKWDSMSFARDFDFSKKISDQLKDLYKDVPHVAINNTNTENSSHTNFALNQKNCYLLFGAGDNEDCLYGQFIVDCKDVIDGLTVYSCELCYEGVASEQCYGCKYFTHCQDCSNCTMVADCSMCRDCIGCFGLHSKQYCLFNEQLSEDEYKRKTEKYTSLNQNSILELGNRFNELKKALPHRGKHIYGSENCTGESIYNSKNCINAFDCKDCEDCKNIYFSPKTLGTMDCTFCAPDGNRYCYEVCSTVNLENSMTNFFVWNGDDVFYSLESHNNSNIFGCVGLTNKKYCILNKQYTKEEYEGFVPKIIEKMKEDGEWGEFFPVAMSPFAYNESIAQEYFPLTKEEVEARGWRWKDQKDEMPNVEKTIPASKLPPSIKDIPNDILNWAIICEGTGRPFKIVKQELEFYRNMNLPIPHFHPDERHKRRMTLRNPRKLWERACNKCGKDIQTTYSPDRPETVYCEECYLKEVY